MSPALKTCHTGWYPSQSRTDTVLSVNPESVLMIFGRGWTEVVVVLNSNTLGPLSVRAVECREKSG